MHASTLASPRAAGDPGRPWSKGEIIPLVAPGQNGLAGNQSPRRRRPASLTVRHVKALGASARRTGAAPRWASGYSPTPCMVPVSWPTRLSAPDWNLREAGATMPDEHYSRFQRQGRNSGVRRRRVRTDPGRRRYHPNRPWKSSGLPGRPYTHLTAQECSARGPRRTSYPPA